MIERDITLEAHSLLKLFYALYRSRRNEGKGRTESIYMGSSEEIKHRYLYRMQIDDVEELCSELSESGYISCINGDDISDEIFLTRKALVYCEQSFSRSVRALLNWVSSIRGILPF